MVRVDRDMSKFSLQTSFVLILTRRKVSTNLNVELIAYVSLIYLINVHLQMNNVCTQTMHNLIFARLDIDDGCK